MRAWYCVIKCGQFCIVGRPLLKAFHMSSCRWNGSPQRDGMRQYIVFNLISTLNFLLNFVIVKHFLALSWLLLVFLKVIVGLQFQCLVFLLTGSSDSYSAISSGQPHINRWPGDTTDLCRHWSSSTWNATGTCFIKSLRPRFFYSLVRFSANSSKKEPTQK